MSITKSASTISYLLLVLSVVLAGLLPSTAVYASEVNTRSGRSIAELTADGLIMDVTVLLTSNLCRRHGRSHTRYLPIINNSAHQYLSIALQ